MLHGSLPGEAMTPAYPFPLGEHRETPYLGGGRSRVLPRTDFFLGNGVITCSYEHVMSTTSPEQAVKSYSNDYTIYKPNQRGSGGAIRFSLNVQKAAMFIDAAAQSGEKQFDWDSKIIMKWGLSDIGAVLALLQHRTAEAKLFHKAEKSTSTFEMILREDPERAPYMLNISRREIDDTSVRKVSLPMTHPEAAILEVALRTAVSRIIGW